MLDTKEFGEYLYTLGLKDFVGVPCSYLSPLINYAINSGRFMMSNNEGDAVAIASGISLCGSEYGVVLMQNSGLSNALSPLTSLNHTFKIPILGFVSLRGERNEKGENTDEPQHELLGIITDKLLSTCEIPYLFLESSFEKAKEQLDIALKYLKNNQSFFFIVRDKTLSKLELYNQSIIESRACCEALGKSSGDKSSIDSKGLESTLDSNINALESKPSRLSALELIHKNAKDCILLATTGKCGRELYEIGDRANQLYMVGSMGCVSSFALGVSLKSSKKVIAIDGDSALLMRLGALSTNAFYAREKSNFCHILLDNESHDSTGGQFNLSPCIDFISIAKSCGYTHTFKVHSLQDFEIALQHFLESKSNGARFIHLKIAKGSKKDLGRPKISPKEVAQRVQKLIKETL